jgi:hypothetical protein
VHSKSHFTTHYGTVATAYSNCMALYPGSCCVSC